jgi:hypothetical protein
LHEGKVHKGKLVVHGPNVYFAHPHVDKPLGMP